MFQWRKALMAPPAQDHPSHHPCAVLHPSPLRCSHQQGRGFCSDLIQGWGTVQFWPNASRAGGGEGRRGET